MKKTIGVFAHVDAGKTTFSEQVLFHTGAIRKKGRVDHQDAFLDTHDIEKRRGITIFAEQAHFTYKNNTYYLIDTPGHVDFSSEMERAIQIIDAAIIIVSGIDGIQSHTETVYDLIASANKPIFFFVNKMDAGHADYEKALKSIQSLSEKAVDFMGDYHEGVAALDEGLMELFFQEDFGPAFDEGLVQLVKTSELYPVYSGSALKDQGIEAFITQLDKLTTSHYPAGDIRGYVYKIRYDDKGVRQTFFKLTSGHLKVRDDLSGQKITEIRRYQGSKYEVLSEMGPGDLCALIGLDLKAGMAIGHQAYHYEMIPTLKSKVVYDPSINPKVIYQVFQKLEDEDPSLKLSFESRTKEITIGIMGDIQLEILKEVLASRFGHLVDFEPPTIIYKETITNTVEGYGHFEPLKHYAEVALRLEPSPRGIEFETTCSTDDLTVGHQNLVKHHIFEKAHRGLLTGSDLTNLKVTLINGRAHNKHTSGGDFREATIRALRQGLEKAECILLEPMYDATITVDMTLMGKIMTDILQMQGTALGQHQDGDNITIVARVPVATFLEYPKKLASLTGGRGRVRMKVAGYEPCHNSQGVIEAIAYDKHTDVEYPSSSIFCAKGKGFTVAWDEVEAHAHVLR